MLLQDTSKNIMVMSKNCISKQTYKNDHLTWYFPYKCDGVLQRIQWYYHDKESIAIPWYSVSVRCAVLNTGVRVFSGCAVSLRSGPGLLSV